MNRLTACLLLAIWVLTTYKSNAQPTQQDQMVTDTSSTPSVQHQLTPKEREYAIDLLIRTERDVFWVVSKLNDTQLKFQPNTDKWSVEDCVKHIAAAEVNLWQMVESSLKQPANPDKRTGIKFTDEQLVNAVEDRSHKAKTFSALEPANSPYKTVTEALASFKNNRQKLIAFVKATPEDLRNHVSELPVGTYDAYQFILLIAAHTNRHTQQIKEVMANEKFPNK